MDEKNNNKNGKRPNWDELYLEMAQTISKRSVCFRSKCGAILVRDNVIISNGYNGSPKNQPNCEEIGYCYRNMTNVKSGSNMELCRAIGSHAESNTIVMSALNGNSTKGATMYVYGNSDICSQCRGVIANAEVYKVIYKTRNNVIKKYYPNKDWKTHSLDKGMNFTSINAISNMLNMINRKDYEVYPKLVYNDGDEIKEVYFDKILPYNKDNYELIFLKDKKEPIICNIFKIRSIFGENWANYNDKFRIAFYEFLSKLIS